MFTRSVMNMEVVLDFPRREQTKFDFLPELGRIKCPTLVLGGEDDPDHAGRRLRGYRRSDPQGVGPLREFPAAGHGIVNDAPERFIQVLKEFVTT